MIHPDQLPLPRSDESEKAAIEERVDRFLSAMRGKPASAWPCIVTRPRCRWHQSSIHAVADKYRDAGWDVFVPNSGRELMVITHKPK